MKWRYKRKFEQGKVAINTARFWGYDKDEYGDLVINQEQAKLVERIFNDYVNGKGSGVIAKEFNNEGIPTLVSGKWHAGTILNMLKNEKYKGDVWLQKTFTVDHLTKKSRVNRGEVDSYYIEGNHPPIVSKELWERAQQMIHFRAEEKGNLGNDREKYQSRYPLTGMLFCSKCGAVLRRRTWNSKLPCRKIVWQCSTYLKEGKQACQGTTIEDKVLGEMNIQSETVVEEVLKDGKKHYRYTSKGK
ncbi:hypothetical protein SCACP_07920 [Sporomusa carbonis]|uniref:recombinase family protein n=1 Tax=Sporomusa carbonis TaxID=3076075 RepID=UPI003A61CA2B